MLERGIDLVYGGGGIGLMGVLADAMLEGGGKVIGIIPRPLATKEVAHYGITELHIVESMHKRKAMMADMADGFAALPGGYGTLEEICEILTWGQLGIHAKPCGLLNVEGFFTTLIDYLNHAVAEGFLKSKYRDLVLLEDSPDTLLERFRTYIPPKTRQWINIEQT